VDASGEKKNGPSLKSAAPKSAQERKTNVGENPPPKEEKWDGHETDNESPACGQFGRKVQGQATCGYSIVSTAARRKKKKKKKKKKRDGGNQGGPGLAFPRLPEHAPGTQSSLKIQIAAVLQ